MMDALIVGFDGDVVDDLEIEGNGDALGATSGIRKKAIVVATAAAEACAVAGEGEAGDKNDVERGDVEARAAGRGLPDVHGAALEVVE